MASTLYISLLICCCCSETVLLLCSRSFWAVLAELKKKNDIPARRIARIAKLMTAICSPCPSPRCAMTNAPAGCPACYFLPLRCSDLGDTGALSPDPATTRIVGWEAKKSYFLQSKYAD